MANALTTFWAGQPRKNQILILQGIPVVILLGLLYWDWKGLGTLGLIDNTIDTTNKLPTKLQRDVPDAIWTDISATQTQIVAQDAIIATGAEVKKQLEALKEDIDNAQAQLPRETEKADMRELIERLAKEIPKSIGTVEFKSVNITDDTNHENGSEPKSMTFQVELMGNQDGIIKYINLIEKNQRFMTVNNIALTSGGYSTDQGGRHIVQNLHTVHMDITTFIYNPEKK